MPIIFERMGYKVYFTSHDANECIHVHIKHGSPTEPATKVWLLANGDLLIANNIGIPNRDMNKLLKSVRDNREKIIHDWIRFFGEISFYG